MRLNLYESIDYLCTAGDELSRNDHLTNLSLLRSQCRTASITLPEDEILLCSTFDAGTHSISPVSFGAGPVWEKIQLQPPFCYVTLPAGAYLFYQFPDPSPEGVESAYRTALSGMDARGWRPKEHSLMLRGVKEGPWYALQVLIPLVDDPA